METAWDRLEQQTSHCTFCASGLSCRNCTLVHSARTCLPDGWAGSMIATEVSDILFGTPRPRKSLANLAVIKEDQVNILVHGHNPIGSEKIVEAVNDPALIALAREKGAAGINLAGLLFRPAWRQPVRQERCGRNRPARLERR